MTLSNTYSVSSLDIAPVLEESFNIHFSVWKFIVVLLSTIIATNFHDFAKDFFHCICFFIFVCYFNPWPHLDYVHISTSIESTRKALKQSKLFSAIIFTALIDVSPLAQWTYKVMLFLWMSFTNGARKSYPMVSFHHCCGVCECVWIWGSSKQ